MIKMCTYSSTLGAKVSFISAYEDIAKLAKTSVSIRDRLQIFLLI